MIRSPVTSKAIKSVGYDPATQTMEVEFAGGACHAFAGVTPEKHKAFMEAPSLGKHFTSQIKPHHASRKL